MTDPFTALFHLDVRTVLVLLFAGNLGLGILILLFQGLTRESSHQGALRAYALARLLQALGWLLMVTGGPWAGEAGLALANNLVVLGFFLESLVALDLARLQRPRARRVHIGLFLAAAAAMNTLFLAAGSPAWRMAAMALGMGAALLVPSVLFLTDPSETPFRRILGGGNLLFLAVLGERTLAALGDRDAAALGLTRGPAFPALILMMVLGGAVVLLLAKEDADREIRELATRDPLTGLCNRRAFTDQASRVLAYHRRFGLDAAMLFIDIDHFKAINDQYGHAAGDQVIVHLASVLRQSLREFDLHCRFGGEEFVLLLPNSHEEEALAVAQRIREGVASHQDPGLPCPYTVSVGLASRLPQAGDPLADLLARSDAALYDAKEAGRDRVRVDRGGAQARQLPA
ncbi:MAG TPA: GGDEF domain-containing protein [Holophaga sp.]|nr:GGDEF domain-containing protein [Holophaga sp.]